MKRRYNEDYRKLPQELLLRPLLFLGFSKIHAPKGAELSELLYSHHWQSLTSFTHPAKAVQ